MATTARGIYYPISSDIMTPLANRFASLAQSVDDALGNIVPGGHFTGTNAERIALTAPARRKGVTFYTSDTNLMWLYDGSNWVIWQARAGVFATATGTVSKRAVSAGSVNNVTITFPAGRFTQPPVLVATGWGDARDMTVQIDNVTTGGANIRLGSMATVSRTLGAHWQATQATSGAAEG